MSFEVGPFEGFVVLLWPFVSGSVVVDLEIAKPSGWGAWDKMYV